KGSAIVKLAPDGDGTILSYEVKATVGGKLAQVGQRFIDSTAKKMADEFFTSFAAITGGELEPVDAIAPTHIPLVPDEDVALSLSPWMWGTILIAGALLGIYLFTM
ncbi:MAG: SRPBCC domain-containing protein, partial [Parvibaculum sp.]